MWTPIKTLLMQLKNTLSVWTTKLQAHLKIFPAKAFVELAFLTMATVAIIAFVMTHRHQSESPNMQVAVIATPAPIVADEPKAAIQIKKPIKVYKHSNQIKSHINLPQAVIEDPREMVLQSSIIPSTDDHPHSVTTTINAETGETQTYVKTEPLPWASWDKRGSAGVYVGFKNSNPAVRLQIKQDFADVKAIRLGVNASIDQVSNGQTDVFVGVGASYNW